MLRITRLNGPQRTVLKLEGRLAGMWVDEVESHCEDSGSDPSHQLVMDLQGVTFIDEAGKKLLRRLWKQGAELAATGCLIEALVEEITREPSG